jgi:class 3 adenylate cyclase
MTMGISRYPFRRLSLTVQMVIGIVLGSFVVWVVLNHIQTIELRKIFQQQLAKRLGQEALEDRLNLDRYIAAHNELVRVLAEQTQLNDYIARQNWSAQDEVRIKYWPRNPPWLPRLSALGTFTRPRHTLLLDGEKRVREVYRSSEDNLPDSLLAPDAYLLVKSHDQSFITTLDGIPYLVTAESVTNAEGAVLATLMFASPMDEEFLVESQGIYRGRLIALVMEDSSKILTSSDLNFLPAESLLDDLEDRYIVTGQEYFEFGGSELAFKVASFVSTDEIESMTEEVITKERRQSALITFIVILFFTAAITVITRKSKRLIRSMIDESEKIFTGPTEETKNENRPKEWDKTLEQQVQDQVAQLARVAKLKCSMSPQIVKLLLAQDAENPLKALRREVTVVFMDLCGFTAFAEVSEPEDLMSALQEYHSEMGRIILEHDGTIMSFAGDGIMIVFNAPIEVPNPSERAVRMTMAMRQRLVELGDNWQKLGYQLDCGFGIAQGYATIGAVGFEGCWDYGAIGTVSNLACRLCDEAKGGQILISKKVLSSVENLIVTEPLPPLRLKGLSRSVSAFSVIRFTKDESRISPCGSDHGS